MKLIVFLFSIYLLALPVLPCMDTDECSESSGTSIVQSGGHNNHQEEEEVCNPFCNCICCGQLVASNFQILTTSGEKTLPVKKLLSCYSSISLPSDFFGNVWQPPKIG